MTDDKIPDERKETRQAADNRPSGDVSDGAAKPKRVRRVFRSSKTKGRKRKAVNPDSPVSDEALERLARIMNDSPSVVKLKDTEWRIKALRPGAQWMIAEEACKIVREENMAMGDVIRQFAANMPSVCRCLTIALLNDKKLIEGREYQRVYDTLMWGEYDMKDWATLLFEVISMINVDFFYASTGAIQTVREILKRKMTARERRLFHPEPNGDR